MITFKNEPKLSEHEADKVFNERRVSLVPHVESYLSTHERFKDKEVSVMFAQRGISSLICIIENVNDKVVLKIPLNIDYATGEALFLKVWEQAGVKVPHIFEEGVLGGHPYMLMEYIDAPVLMEAYSQEERIGEGVYLEMGHTLRIMHIPEATGYGSVKDNRAEYAHFDEWLLGPDIKKRITYVHDNGLLGDEHGSIALAFEVLQEHVKNNPKSSYCHDDFGAGNIFATKPLTVFDPNPRFNNGYLDLGRSMTIHISKNIFPEQLLAGYFGDERPDYRVLHAAVMLNTYMKFPYWHKVKRVEQIPNMQEYLKQNKSLLSD